MKKAEKNMSNPFLMGKRVYLRPVDITDAPVIQRWHNDRELITLGSGDGLPSTRIKEEEDIRSASQSKDEAYLMVLKRSNNSTIGFIRVNWLTSSNKNVWLRIIIGEKKAWGKHYASDALRCVLEWLFFELNIHRVTLETYGTNKRAITFFEKMGFQREGILREAHFQGGTYHDIISFGLLKKEFRRE